MSAKQVVDTMGVFEELENLCRQKYFYPSLRVESCESHETSASSLLSVPSALYTTASSNALFELHSNDAVEESALKGADAVVPGEKHPPAKTDCKGHSPRGSISSSSPSTSPGFYGSSGLDADDEVGADNSPCVSRSEDAWEVEMLKYRQLNRSLCAAAHVSLEKEHIVATVEVEKSVANQANNPAAAALTPTTEAVKAPKLERKKRPIIIDGQNVACRYRQGKSFEVRGLILAIAHFQNEGFDDIKIIMPKGAFNKFRQRGLDVNEDDWQKLSDLEIKGFLIWCGGGYRLDKSGAKHRFNPHDDVIIIEDAFIHGGAVLSNDKFKDILKEHPEWEEVITKRVLDYFFIKDRLVIPKDPHGRKGPTYDEIVHFAPGESPPVLPSSDDLLASLRPQSVPNNLCLETENMQYEAGYPARVAFGPLAENLEPAFGTTSLAAALEQRRNRAAVKGNTFHKRNHSANAADLRNDCNQRRQAESSYSNFSGQISIRFEQAVQRPPQQQRRQGCVMSNSFSDSDDWERELASCPPVRPFELLADGDTFDDVEAYRQAQLRGVKRALQAQERLRQGQPESSGELVPHSLRAVSIRSETPSDPTGGGRSSKEYHLFCDALLAVFPHNRDLIERVLQEHPAEGNLDTLAEHVVSKLL